MLLPEWARRYVFCGTFRPPVLTPVSRTLSGTLLCGVRTFLSLRAKRKKRPSGPAAYFHIISMYYTGGSAPASLAPNNRFSAVQGACIRGVAVGRKR
jgi:hypothetical protein